MVSVYCESANRFLLWQFGWANYSAMAPEFGYACKPRTIPATPSAPWMSPGSHSPRQQVCLGTPRNRIAPGTNQLRNLPYCCLEISPAA